jgi:tetratricopeptide (TPR) repeat protein
MKIDPLLNKAASLAKRKDYDGAIKILKAEEDRYYGSFKYYYLYGVICLHAGSYVDALSNFNMARKIRITDPSIMLGFAVLYLKRLDTVQALNYYLEVQERDPKNKIAKRALFVIRKYSSPEVLSDWMTPERLSRLFPPIPSPLINTRNIITGTLILCVSAVIVYGILVSVNMLPNPVKKPDGRLTTEFFLTGEERSDPVETGGVYRYILTRDQATTLYDRGLSLFTDYRDEAAKISLNRILESNASESIKNKARLLFLYMEPPGFHNFRRSDNVSITEVRDEPYLYRDVYVIWYGMATNVEITDDFTRFDFLVGYDIERPLEGLVSVVFDIPVAVNTGRPLEVLGKITLDNSPHGFRLNGSAIHQSGRLNN